MFEEFVLADVQRLKVAEIENGGLELAGKNFGAQIHSPEVGNYSAEFLVGEIRRDWFFIKAMDVRSATAMAKVSGAVHGAEGLCGLLPLQTNFGRSVRET